MSAAPARFLLLFLVCGLLSAAQDSAAPRIRLSGTRWSVEIDPSTLAATASFRDGSRLPVSIGTPGLGTAARIRQKGAAASWELPELGAAVQAGFEGDRFSVEIRARRTGMFTWPAMRVDAPAALILPLAEGLYVPVGEPRWRDFVSAQSPFRTMSDLTMPLWAVDYGKRSLTYILTEPMDNSLSARPLGAGLELRLTHEFQRNSREKRYGLTIVPGGGSPIAPARVFREWLVETGQFVSLREKMNGTPDVRKLLGAAHVYLWASSAGGAISPAMIRRFQQAGLDRLWLGVSDLNVLRRVPQTVRAAERAGYLFASYDSYHSIHPPGAERTWDTAQFDRKLYDEGAIVQANGRRDRGFQGVGSHLSSSAAEPYVKRRVAARMARYNFNSYFVDCDASGELFDNYSPRYPATKRDDMNLRLQRLAWIRDTYSAVVGSETGAWFSAPVIHFAHGMMTPPFGFRDPLLHDRKSPYFVGRWYPEGAPEIFLKQTALPEKYREIYFDERYRVPLYQAAFHDSVVTTHHWLASSLKFANVRRVNELLELLYGVPPLYHLDLDAWRRRRDEIARHCRFFSANYGRLALLPLTAFAWLTPDHEVQETRFGDEAAVIANFGTAPYAYRGHDVPPGSVLLLWTGTGKALSYTSQYPSSQNGE